jgi:mannosyltransferase
VLRRVRAGGALPIVSAAVGDVPRTSAAGAASRLSGWWPLAALILLAASLRLPTLGSQSFWYDEAFTPVHVIHPSLWGTLSAVVHTENTPPLWYLIVWADARLLGTGEVALRLPSALAGIAAVPVAWAIGRELAGARAALACAALVAVNPLFVWYSQEARAYGLFVLCAALAMLCFVRASKDPTPARMVAFALSGALALLTHYFAVFLLIPMALLLLADRRTRRASLPAVLGLAAVGAALLPLIAAQGGHGTQWIGRWPLAERLEAIPQYYLLVASGAPLGHGVELLVALPLLGALAVGLWGLTDPSAGAQARRAASAPHAAAARVCAIILAGALLIPLALVAFGADYLAPRNLVGAMIPLTALIAVIAVAPAARRAGPALAVVCVLAFLAISIDVALSPRLQRGNWRGVAAELRGAPGARAITTVELGSAPLEYYLPGLHKLTQGASVTVVEIDETGYAPLRAGAGRPPAPGFRLVSSANVDGLRIYRFRSPVPRTVTEATLRRHVITLAPPRVLVPAHAEVTR